MRGRAMSRGAWVCRESVGRSVFERVRWEGWCLVFSSDQLPCAWTALELRIIVECNLGRAIHEPKEHAHQLKNTKLGVAIPGVREALSILQVVCFIFGFFRLSSELRWVRHHCVKTHSNARATY